MFLRMSLKSDEYKKMIAYPETASDLKSKCILNLIHGLCKAFFYRKGGIKEELICFIHRLIRLGEEKKIQKLF